jgi:uncharacterized protein (TIGR02996 family)
MEEDVKIRGEYWVIDGSVDFADGDVGDRNHEMIAMEHVFSEYMNSIESLMDEYNIEHDEFEYDGVNIEAIESALSALEEYLTTGLRDDGEDDGESPPEIQPISEQEADALMMREIGCNADAYYILRGGGDGRLYCMQYEGWIAVRNNNVELYGFDSQRRAEVAEAIAEIIYEDLGLTDEQYDPNEVQIYIYDVKTKRGLSTSLLELAQPGQTQRIGMNIQAHTKPPKDQYLTWNPKDTTENTPNWGTKPPMKKPDAWTQAARDKGLGYHPPWKGTSEGVLSFYEWMRLISESNEEVAFIRSFFKDRDLTTLLVFADWLQDHDDPRVELVRNAVENRLRPNSANKHITDLAQSLEIERPFTRTYESKDMVRISLNVPFAYSEKENQFYQYNMGTYDMKVPLIEVPDKILERFFWGLISYGMLL